jgi:4-hydroxyphenylacetate 3-monooxygenase
MLRTGERYLADLGAREVDVVVDSTPTRVVDHPSLARQGRRIARYYDAQRTSSEITLRTASGALASWIHHSPHTHDELRRRSAAFLAIARHYEGFFGRAPDYMATVVAAYGSASEAFGEYAGNMARFARDVAERDLYVTHSTTPLRSRSGGANDLRLRRQPDGGVIVRGVRAMATSAPLSDELFILPQPPGGIAVPVTFVASVPTDSPGLRFLCRASFPGRSRIGNDYEEADALVMFDDVHVPRERIFVLSDGNQESWRTRGSAAAHIALQTTARAIAKLESVIGLVKYASDLYGLETNEELKTVVGRALRDLALLRACRESAVESGCLNEVGVYVPKLFALNAARTFFMESYPKLVSQLRHVVASEIYHLFDPSPRPEVETMLREQWNVDSDHIVERQRLTLALHDLLASEFAVRQELYEAHYLGSERRNAIRIWDQHRDECRTWDASRLDES